MTLKTLGMGVVKYLKSKSKKTSDVDLKSIHDKFFDKSGLTWRNGDTRKVVKSVAEIF